MVRIGPTIIAPEDPFRFVRGFIWRRFLRSDVIAAYCHA